MSEIEKQFFETFGIKPRLTFYDLVRLKEDTDQEFGGRCAANWHGETKEETIRRFSPTGWKVLECKDVYTYPEITNRILLELICAYNNFQNDTASLFIPFDCENIKNNILTFLVEEINEKHKNRYFCNDVDKLKRKVQAIFKENN